MNLLHELYHQLYETPSLDDSSLFQEFMVKLTSMKAKYETEYLLYNLHNSADWYKDAVIYSTYVDLFNHDFNGLAAKLDYLQQLGINCLWLLPILESPMKDAGFDISNYKLVRTELLGLPSTASSQDRDESFATFINEAKKRNIRIIFDIAMNHCSVEHPWFKEAKQSKQSEYRDYFIWNDDTQAYTDARIIFKGICESNWEFEPISQQYYFHRFFEIQPDLNYKNPKVLLEMSNVLAQWKLKGIDGFRADAVPYIWKEEGTNCENLHKTHVVVKFFRAVLDYISPGSLLLAEACQQPIDVVAYFGSGDECNAAYHFPVMPRIYKALAQQDGTSIQAVLNKSFTPMIPDSCQWFMFLRCHDELTLEMVTPEEREYIYSHYAKKPSWDFRLGEGISARLAELFDFDKKRILLAYSISFTLLGTPIIYYGDEFGKGNDEAYYEKTTSETGYADSRYLARGPIDWDFVDTALANPASLGYQMFHALQHMLTVRKKHLAFSRGTLTFIESLEPNPHILSYVREYEDKKILILENLSLTDQYFVLNKETMIKSDYDELGQTLKIESNQLKLSGSDYVWINI